MIIFQIEGTILRIIEKFNRELYEQLKNKKIFPDRETNNFYIYFRPNIDFLNNFLYLHGIKYMLWPRYIQDIGESLIEKINPYFQNEIKFNWNDHIYTNEKGQTLFYRDQKLLDDIFVTIRQQQDMDYRKVSVDGYEYFETSELNTDLVIFVDTEISNPDQKLNYMIMKPYIDDIHDNGIILLCEHLHSLFFVTFPIVHLNKRYFNKTKKKKIYFLIFSIKNMFIYPF